MINKKSILSIVGTRPEAIKMAPVIRHLENSPWADSVVLVTGQHRELVDQVLRAFSITADLDLNVMQPGQSLSDLTARLTTGIDRIFTQHGPFDAVLAQGDTTTVMAAALVSLYHRFPFGHVEAGLRTFDLLNPFPEEANRLIATRLARWHFAPTAQAQKNLLREGVDPDSIIVTGNTVIDALLQIAPNADNVGLPLDAKKRLILVTAHRRESFGAPLASIVAALSILVDRYPDIQILYPVHPNPAVQSAAAQLANHPRIILSPPLDYVPFVAAMKRAHIILTDSGGVQEEGPALGKPVLVMRDATERPEAVELGVVRQVGTRTNDIVNAVAQLLDDNSIYGKMACGVSPYGDGRATERIVGHLAYSLLPESVYAEFGT